MVVDFSKLGGKDRPRLVLRSMDGRAIQTLGYAFNISLEANYNEISTLSFDYPAHIEGKRVPGYDKLVGMRIIEMVGVAQFIVNNPNIKESATKELKTVTAHSLDYEFTFKKITLTSGTYNFCDPTRMSTSVLGILLEKMPTWSIGAVDSALFGKYRTFEVTNENLYSFMKGTLQDTYGCVFDFDTMRRLVNVRDVSQTADTQPVYISLNNLAKEITLEEETENIFTCLDVNGAEGVSIRGVNPTGNNVLYNLDFFMNTDNFSQTLIDKWKAWVQGVESRRQEYYNLTVENALLHTQVETEKASLLTLQGELKTLESQLAVAVEAAAQGIEIDLLPYKQAVEDKQYQISRKTQDVARVNAELEESQAGLVAVNEQCSWEAFGITSEEESLLGQYIKEDSIEDGSFVCPAVESYTTAGESFSSTFVSVEITRANITGSPLASGKMVYSIRGGRATVKVDGEVKLSGAVIQGAFDTLNDKGTCCLYMESGCVTFCGSIGVNTDCSALEGNVVSGTSGEIVGLSANAYITKQLTAYAKKTVEWDLLEYGREVLSKVSSPSYSFSIDSGNFLAMDDFDAFCSKLRLGDRLYLNMGGDFGVLQPVLIGAHISFDEKQLSLEFSNHFSLSDSAFRLADLLDQSISMGKSVDLNKYNYSAFTNAGGTSGVQQLMDTMRDVALNGIFSSGNQAWTLDDAGLRLRKWKDKAREIYEDAQVWMTNNQIVFTDDNWNSAILALGNFSDKNLGSMYGIVAPNIVGTLLAGKNLVIESEKQDGGVSVFKVDGNGAKLYNSQFDLVNDYIITKDDGSTTKYGQISLHPSIGIVAGNVDAENDFFSYDSKGNIRGIRAQEDRSRYLTSADRPGLNGWKYTPAANFWVDMKGNVFMRGNVYATDGVFNGTVYATAGKFEGTVQASDFLDSSGKSMLENGKWKQEHLSIKSLNVNNRFKVSESGQVTITTNGAASPTNNVYKQVINLNDGQFVLDEGGNVTMKGKIDMSGASTITWGSSPVQYRYAAVADPSGSQIHTSFQAGDIYRQESLDGGKTWGTWYQFIGKDGKNGTPGVSNYFHVKYSDDGKTFTANNGETLGEWMGTCVTSEEADPTTFSAYTWKRTTGLQGPDGKEGESCYFYVKFSAYANGRNMTEEPNEETKYMGVCSTNSPKAPTDYKAYTWTRCKGEDGEDAAVTQANIIAALTNPPEQSFITVDSMGAPQIHGGTIYGSEFHGLGYTVWCDPEKYGAYEPAFTVQCKLDEGWFAGFQIQYMDTGLNPYVKMTDAGSGATMTIDYPWLEFASSRTRVDLGTAYAVSMPYGSASPSDGGIAGRIDGQVYFQIV